MASGTPPLTVNSIIYVVIKMLEKIENMKKTYRTLGSNTRFMIRISFISVIVLLLSAIYAYTATHSENHYELLKIADDLLECSKSVAITGFAGVLVVSYMEK